MFAISPALEAARSWFPLRLLVRAARRYSADDCALLAASISYYVLFSIFPLLIFVVGILGLFLVDSSLQQDVIDKVMDILPLSEDSGRNSVADTVHAVAGYQGSAIGILGLLVMAWSGSNMFGAVRKALNRVFAVSQKRPLWRQKLTDAAMALALVLFFVISLAITTVLRLAERYSDEIPYFGDLAQRLGFVWIVPALLLPLLLSFAAFTVLYWLVPTGHRNPREVWQGALLAAVAFEVTKSLFGIYLQNFSNYDVVFGSLGAVAAFLFAVYVSAGIMLFGAEVAAEYPRLRAEPAPVRVPRVIQPKRPSWRQRAQDRLHRLVGGHDASGAPRP